MAISERVEALTVKGALVQRVFATPDGKQLLDLLRAEFLGRLDAREPHQIIFNAGRADVVAYLLQLNSLGGR